VALRHAEDLLSEEPAQPVRHLRAVWIVYRPVRRSYSPTARGSRGAGAALDVAAGGEFADDVGVDGG